MCERITELFLQAGYRRPVCLVAPIYMGDLQDLAPWAWCSKCGAEVYRQGAVLCRRCMTLRKGGERNGTV